jgi:hypothetical protein
MNNQSLTRGNQLVEEIAIIKKAMESLANRKTNGYSLHISEFRDGSSMLANLAGANITEEVIDAVYDVLVQQLALREEEFEKL